MPGSARRPAAAPGRLPAVFFVTLGFIQAIWPLTMDLYLPSFPQIERELATAPSLVQFTLTGAFIGMAAGQLVAGPLSDRIGRIRPLLAALAVYTVASVGCALAPSIEVLIGVRVAQGIGASATAVIILAIVRDRAEGPVMVKLLARLQLINGVFVVASPALGAQLLGVTDWRGLFWLLVVYGAVMLVAAATVLGRGLPRPATGARAGATGRAEMDGGDTAATDTAATGAPAVPGARLIDDYRALLGDRRYRAAVGAGALQWAAMMSYMASSAFLFQGVFGLDELQYAIVFGGHGALMIAGAQISARLAGRVDITVVARVGAVVLFGTALVLLAGQLWLPGLGLLVFLLPLFAFTTTFGVISPTLQSTALADHGSRAGAAASLIGATNMISGAVASPLVGLFGVATTVPAATVMTIASGASALVLVLGFRTRRRWR
ncbi:multidrug effflux MFS transporter [Herbiconiux flava]|uniref:DHA1 family bicyclomycin/chloramphenicol resistance-like MFS transporter n=1 Tax=Herbiconiux flava TaxID=881268 RepID=A0A852SJ14_9MICO|nr:multidrug effflux MFS transporter [Herbiconiux flava]NYD69844.1 DHA1 family bicyclomycin/chloramphenicol resistance-like MFS transporter [Herbiconiux flava]GLK16593.1 Bcr/CflA family drug resistance efflux transporter [Herbiconiux flava]